MPDSTFDEIGSHAVPGPYDSCGDVKCIVCHAPAGSQCVNPVTGKTRRMPCIGRIERRR